MSHNISYNVHLHEAVTQGDPEWTEVSLGMGADPNSINEKGNTPLHVFVLYAGTTAPTKHDGIPLNDMEHEANNKAILELLMKHGAKMDKKNTAGQNPIELAQNLDKWDVALMLATYTIDRRRQ